MSVSINTTNDGLHVLVVGAGMYTCGRGTDGFGTVLPALFEAAKSEQLVRRITCCATSTASASALAEKAQALATHIGHEVELELWPRDGDDVQTYRNVLALAESGHAAHHFDCAIAAVPDHLHYQLAKDLLEANLHTMLVKPFVTRLDEGRELVELAVQKDRLAVVEFHKRWDQSNLLLRDRLAAGKIGAPLYFHVEYSQRRSIPEETFALWVRDTNIFQYLGVHYADMVWFVTGALPCRVLSTGQKSRLASRGIDTPDAMQTLIEWDLDGHRFVSTHLTHWVDPNTTSAMSNQAIKVIGTDGRIECDQKHRGIQTVTERAGVEDLNPYFSCFYREPNGSHRFAGYGYESFRTFLGDVAGIRRGERTSADFEGTRPTFRSSLVSTAIVEASNESLARDGAWVEIPDDLDAMIR